MPGRRAKNPSGALKVRYSGNDKIERMPQSLSNLLTHLVFSTSHRNPKLTPEVREQLFPYFTGTLRNLGCPLIQVGGVEDHVHILFALSRTECLANVVGKVKGSSPVWIKEQWPNQKDFAWQAGYGALSVGQNEVDVVVRYIQNQEEHHRKLSFQEEYRMWMRLAGIEVDERYVWD